MRLALFGPIFVVPAQSVLYFVVITYRYSKNLVSIEKNEEKKRKKLTYHFCHLCLICHAFGL